MNVIITNIFDITYSGIKFKGQRNINGLYYDYNNGVIIDDVKRKSRVIEEFLFLFWGIIWIKL